MSKQCSPQLNDRAKPASERGSTREQYSYILLTLDVLREPPNLSTYPLVHFYKHF
ncbi:hypothetical protein MKleb_5901 (plasmid) [Klebsiella sp. PL-2018]|nr:hypothetical protein MKleb_5826 [Klebsiella sp. PL-2018]QXD01402.1 hypothetical protein MKleb_5901 [Klebsiella sp. PL-2018]